MKFLVQSDDYGMTIAQAHGALYGIKHGIVRNTGFFPNMPWAEECAEMIKPYLDQIAFGIDLNASTGPSVLGHAEVPSLTHEDGTFLTSGENRKLDETAPDHDHVNYEELYKEFDAQIQKFIKLIGKKPDYIHGHAYGTKTTSRVRKELAEKYGIVTSDEIRNREDVCAPMMGWYVMPPTLDNQRKSSLKNFILEDKAGFLKSEIGVLICHTGYVEANLFDLSSFNVYRAFDLEGVTAPEVLKWVEDNNVELISYKDLAK